MRPTVILGFIAVVTAAVTVGTPAGADGDNFDPDFSAPGQITIETGNRNHPGFHVNPDYTWSFKWMEGDKQMSVLYCPDTAKCHGVADYLPSKDKPLKIVLHGLPSGKTGVLRGAVCTDSDCRPFKREGVTIK